MLKTSMKMAGLIVGLCVLATAPVVASESIVVAELKLQGSNNSLIQRNESFRFDRLRLIDEFYTLLGSPNDQILLKRLNLTVVQTPGTDTQYTVGFNAENVTLPEPFLSSMSETASLPQIVDDIRMFANVTLSEEWDLLRAQSNSISISKIEIENATVQTGRFFVSATGEMDVDTAGAVIGNLEVQVTNWKQALDFLVFKNPEQKPAIEAFLQGFAEGDTLTLPLQFIAGNITLGPFVLGTMPPLVLP